MQNDRARACLPVDAKRPCGFIKVADRGRDQFAIARAGQEAGSQKIGEFSVGVASMSARACASEKCVALGVATP